MRVAGIRPRRVLLGLALLVVPLLLVACTDPQSTVQPHSDNTRYVQTVYQFVTILAAIVFVAILGATLWLTLAFRERPGRVARQIHGNARLEIVWTLIPVLIVAAIAVPTMNAIAKTSEAPPADAIKVIATGHQWWFEFQYPDLKITTANELHVPAGRAVEVEIHSDDVIHSFWIPQLAGKVDMVPGHNNFMVFTPDADASREEPYLGQCAEYCGTSHANMRFRVYVDQPAKFDEWSKRVAGDRIAPTDELAKKGEQVFLSSACVGCHTVQGTIAAGKVGPNLSHVGSRGTIAAGLLPNTPENLVRWISNPKAVKPGVVKMPAFEGQLTTEQLQAIAAYLQSLK